MKSTCIIRRIDDLGRIVIPKEIRRFFGVREGDPLEISVRGTDIILHKYESYCTLCGNTDKYSQEIYPDKRVCTACVKMIVRDADKLQPSKG